MKISQLFFVFVLMVFSSCSSDEPDPDRVDEVIITPKIGVGNINFTDDGNKVIAEYGGYDRITVIRSLSDAAYVMWYDNGFGCQLNYTDTEGYTLQEALDMADELIDLNKNIIQFVLMSPFNAKTEEGITIGSSRANVVAAYGEPDKTTSFSETYDTLGFIFEYNTSDNVRRIDLFVP